jgi:Leucine-rich repeat (LRR) protein
MQNNKLRVLPEELFALPLTEIDISENALTCISDSILKLTNLRTLDIRRIYGIDVPNIDIPKEMPI